MKKRKICKKNDDGKNSFSSSNSEQKVILTPFQKAVRDSLLKQIINVEKTKMYHYTYNQIRKEFDIQDKKNKNDDDFMIEKITDNKQSLMYFFSFLENHSKEIKKFAKKHLKLKSITKKSENEVVTFIVNEYFGIKENFEVKRLIEKENLENLDWNETRIEFFGIIIPDEIFLIIIDYLNIYNTEVFNSLSCVNIKMYCHINLIYAKKVFIFVNSNNVKKIPLIVLKNIKRVELGDLVHDEIRYFLDNTKNDSMIELNLEYFIRRKLDFFFKYITEKELCFRRMKTIIFPFLTYSNAMKPKKIISLSNYFPNLTHLELNSLFIVDLSNLKIRNLKFDCSNIDLVNIFLNMYSDTKDFFKFDCRYVESLTVFGMEFRIGELRSKNVSMELKEDEQDLLDIILDKFENVKNFKMDFFVSQFSSKKDVICDKIMDHFRDFYYEKFELEGPINKINEKNLDWLLKNVHQKLVLNDIEPTIGVEILKKIRDSDIIVEDKIFKLFSFSFYNEKLEFEITKIIFSLASLKKRPPILITFGFHRRFFPFTCTMEISLNNNQEVVLDFDFFYVDCYEEKIDIEKDTFFKFFMSDDFLKGSRVKKLTTSFLGDQKIDVEMFKIVGDYFESHSKNSKILKKTIHENMNGTKELKTVYYF